jgi:trehalose 6-phosphate synthase
MASRLICVSNRVSLPRKAAAPGGLAVGVLGALKHTGGMWFGWGGELTDAEPRVPDMHLRDGVTYALIELRRGEFERYYNGFSNESLWPLFHYMPGRFRFKHDELEAYENVNRQFAQQLSALLQPDDIIWIHDYHLIPMARLLRGLGVRNPIGFFLHIPFPSIEVLRVLPTYDELLRDLTAYDLVGFQVQSDLQSFLAGVQHTISEAQVEADGRIRIGERKLRAAAFPIGVDVDGIQAEAARAFSSAVVRKMVDSLVGRKLVIGVDRLDYSKGLVERFAAYEQFLEAFPDNRSKVTYLQIAPLSRKDVLSYAEIRRSLEQAAGRLNGRFADTDWTPIRYLNRNFPHESLMGFLRAAQVGLVTPLRDGMNLVAKEFLAAQDPSDPGVLVLSSLAGAARELSGAIQINPYDSRAVGYAIQTALTMSLSERRDRHRAMLESLRKNDIATWANNFVTMLNETRTTSGAAPRVARLPSAASGP